MKIRLSNFTGVVAAAFVAGFLGVAQPAHAAAGWTDFGYITELNQNPPVGVGNELLFMRVSVTPAANPSDSGQCFARDGFYLPVTTDFQKRLFSMLMAAKLAERRVRIYVTSTCHLWGYAEMQGLVLE